LGTQYIGRFQKCIDPGEIWMDSEVSCAVLKLRDLDHCVWCVCVCVCVCVFRMGWDTCDKI
jgi:hypothetical protein